MSGPSRPTAAAGSSRRRERRVQPPRPPNAWILYRSSKFDLIRKTSERLSQATVSKRVSYMWRNETEQVRQHFERMAESRKAEHQRLYPDYRFSPKRKEEKERAKEGRKRGRRANMSKDRDATPADAIADAGVGVGVDANATVAMPAPPPIPIPYMPQSYLPGYQLNMVLPHPYMIHYLPEAHYGPGCPSPPISATSSPAQYENSQSSKAQPYPEENMVSSSSNLSARPSPSSESQASSSSSQLPLNVSFLSSHSSSRRPSPDTYATQPLPIFSHHLSSLDSKNLEEVVNFDIPIDGTHNFTQFSQDFGGGPSFEESLQGMLSTTDENGVWNFSNVDTSDLLIHPQGDLEVAMGSQDSTVDYNGGLFADFDFAQLQQQMASFTGSASSSTAVVSAQEDLHTPNNPDIQVYTTTRQRQPSVFTQEMMDFFNFEAAERPTEDTSTIFPVPVPTTVAPQQVRLQSIQHAATMPIFTQMTNAPAVVPCTVDTSYVPPTGATSSSMRRAAGSWKVASDPLLPQVEESFLPWTFSTT